VALFERADGIAPTRLVRVELGQRIYASLPIRIKADVRHSEPRWRPPALALSTPIGQRYKSTQLTRRMVTVAISSEIM
jgi:hypothetical protein